jgi:hypothetical protein
MFPPGSKFWQETVDGQQVGVPSSTQAQFLDRANREELANRFWREACFEQ